MSHAETRSFRKEEAIIESGKIDIDRITSTISTNQREKIQRIKKIINTVETRVGKDIPIEDVLEIAQSYNIPEDDTESALEYLRKSGDIFEPKRGFLHKM